MNVKYTCEIYTKRDTIIMATKGIYFIKNKITGDFYIGSAYGKCGIEGRNDSERKDLRNDKWLCENKTKRTFIQNAWNKYGEEAFEFIIVEICPDTWTKEQVLEREQLHLNEHWESRKLYNLSKFAQGGTTLVTKETRKKLSISGKIAQNKPEVKAANSKKQKEVQNKQEVRIAKSMSLRITYARQEVKAAKSVRQTGTRRSRETRDKMSITHNTLEVKEKKRKSLKATLALPEVRAKRSGENAPNVKLTWQLVNEMREKYANGATIVSLAKEYNSIVSFSTVNKVIHNQLWKQ